MKTIAKMGFALASLLLATVGNLRAEDHATIDVGDMKFVRPAGWEWVEPASSMRKGQLKVKDAEGKASAEVVFFQFPGGAGTVKANVDRWLGQFEEPRDKINAKVEEVTIGKAKVTYVQAEGTYSSGMPGHPATPMKDYALIGAIISPESSTDGDVYVRITGPKALVKASAAEFKKMIESGPKKN
jgi:hypothetical protein